jgi:hypothetical protein
MPAGRLFSGSCRKRLSRFLCHRPGSRISGSRFLRDGLCNQRCGRMRLLYRHFGSRGFGSHGLRRNGLRHRLFEGRLQKGRFLAGFRHILLSGLLRGVRR